MTVYVPTLRPGKVELAGARVSIARGPGMTRTWVSLERGHGVAVLRHPGPGDCPRALETHRTPGLGQPLAILLVLFLPQ